MSQGSTGAKPLEIASQGYLFAGGRMADGAQPFTGQMYVEYQIPQQRPHPYPIVMIEGGGQTGANFTGTPDGREGWAQYFLRRGFAVYVADQVGRGRSGYNAETYGPTSFLDLTFLMDRFVAPERAKRWPQAHLHTQFPGDATPEDPAFLQFLSQEVPSIADYALQQQLNTAALLDLLERIGPAILLTHSQSGPFGWAVGDARPDLVKAILAVEPNGPPVHDIVNTGAPDWFRDVPETKLYGLGMVPLTYDPPLSDPADLRFTRAEGAGGPGLVRCWLQEEPARRLPRLANVPILIVEAEASYHTAYDYCTVAYLAQAGVKSTYVRLPDRGIRGNGHMMMLEKNSDDIAGVLAEWLTTVVP